MSDWLTIRVVLTGTADTPLIPPAGRILLCHADHSFADVAEAIDVAFARWDLSQPHEFRVDGRTLASGEGGTDDDAEDSEEVTLREVNLRLGEQFTYVFDLGEGWQHECSVESFDVDAARELGEEPEGPVPVFGWGMIPDQYWRTSDEDLDDDGWSVEETWEVVRSAIGGGLAGQPDTDLLAAAAGRVREHAHDRGWPYGALMTAAGLDAASLPTDDGELWVETAAGVLVPGEDLPVGGAEAAAWTAVDPADWAAVVIELVRSGPGTLADASGMLDAIARCPEVEESHLSPEDEHTLLRGLDLSGRLLEVLGALDGDRRLTLLGQWGLPRALERGLLA